MGRGGTKKDRDAGPERKCIATGEVQPKSGLIRFVVGPEGVIIPDLAEKLPGRGIWVAATRDAVTKAIKKRLFARAARQSVEVPDDLGDRLEALMLKRVTDLISLARKAGRAIAGYEKVKGALLTEEAKVLIQASDGSERGKTKLRAPDGENTFIGCLTAQELGLSFGRDHVIHAALAAGGLTKRVVEDAARLSGLREMNGENAPERT
ncbi:RNA-binding protein [Actibacterium sp. 188UL27-1]|uniref:RNA-binding protein n=1 Tax=Actibacterium sp. 188UL27-1 TaxID=2786961 RepID=UPI00195887BD|nr:RNA-binding protein [Actibacterium sp. 188UL27-1]MBM7067045.1 RNA-binding protein [Actibacterium sp. 188UL27-1]